MHGTEPGSLARASLRPPLTSVSHKQRLELPLHLSGYLHQTFRAPEAPEGRQDIALPIASQEVLGPLFIVKTPYNFTESSASLVLEIRDLAPSTIPIESVSFTDTDLAMGVLGGSISITAASAFMGFRVYRGRNSTHPMDGGSPGLPLVVEYFYLTPGARYEVIPDLDSMVPDLVQVESQVNHPSTSEAFPGVAVSDAFATRWTGYISIGAGGNYIFNLSSNDGNKL